MREVLFKNFIEQNEIIEARIKEIEEKEKSKFRPIRLNDAKRFSINGMLFSKETFSEAFKDLIGVPPEHKSLLKVWQNSDKASMLNVNCYTFVIEY